jgi:hypothetical protein
MAVKLRLSLNGVVVEFPAFMDGNYPRVPLEEGDSEVDYSKAGTPSVNGPEFPDKHLWTINSYCSAAQRKLLQAFREEYQYLRRNLGNYHILVEDYTDKLVERGTTPTRAIATGAPAAELINGGSHVAYFAKFKGALIKGPSFEKEGKIDFVRLSIQETIKVVA